MERRPGREGSLSDPGRGRRPGGSFRCDTDRDPPDTRAPVPEPTDPSLWPARTETTTDDVLVAAVSMVRLAELTGTLCVRTADQAPPRYRLRG